MTYRIIQGDNRETLKTIPDNSIDAIVTDPPYGIDFLGKDWDANTGSLETYKECLRVLKPGGHILAFSAARTYHHLAVTIEQAGFEIRDQIMWIYSSGFPKSQDVGRSIQRSLGVKKTKSKPDLLATGRGLDNWSKNLDGGSKKESNVEQVVCTDDAAKQWAGWGTALKPAHEPICMARKPIKQSIAKNVQEHGTGALNIDATRVPYTDPDDLDFVLKTSRTFKTKGKTWTSAFDEREVRGDFEINQQGRFPSNVLGDIPDYQKYFYCPKVSRKERHMGFEGIKSLTEQLKSIGGYFCNEKGEPTDPSEHTPLAYVPEVGIVQSHSVIHHISEKVSDQGNNHPTVKPVELMKYLIKLVTPPGGTVLDPFNGSGSTGMAAVSLGHNYIGCELDQNYVDISLKRIEAYNKPEEPNNTFNDIFEEK